MTTILVVDDNPTFRAQAARLCEREGFKTCTAGSVSELATVLGECVPDLVLVDIELPQIPGHRLGALIRSRHQVPIVLVSALTEERLRRLFDASDAEGWICKPLTREKLVAAVTRFVLNRGTRNDTSANEPVPTTPRDKTAVLLVEDEPVIADRIAFALAEDCSVTIVPDGESAMHHLMAGNFDCTLLDLTLAHLSGFDVLRHMLVRQPELLRRTVIMTAASDESLQFIDPTAVGGVLRKPFDLGTLPEIVKRVANS